ncbi:MAG TPA: glycosyltransferase family 39 protein [Gemmataceae bacterium]|nr:glycosyltransferase family 39 protein [Gemmataceae bacterium]
MNSKASHPPPVKLPQASRRPEHQPVLACLAWCPVLAIATAVGVVLLLTSGRMGYFADELYFLVAGRHLDWGYADQGPLVPLLARAMDVIFPGSLAGERAPVTVLTAAGVIVAALIARELGGRHRAQVLAAGTYAMASMPAGHLLMTATVDGFFWALTTWLLVRWVRLRDDRLLLWLGVVTAIALENKWLIASFWGVVAICALAVGPRELLRRPLLWLSAAFVTLATLPNLLWQAHHGWPLLAMTQVIAHEENLIGGRWTFLPLMLMTAGVGTGIALYCYGLSRLLRSSQLRPYRFLGYTFVGLVMLFLAADGRFDYVAGFQTLLFAVGAVELQRREPARWWRWILTWPAYVLSAIIALTTLPIMPVSWPTPAKPISLATLGWPELTNTVASAYRTLPPAIQHTTAVVTDAYWDAGALDRYGPARGLPHPFSPDRGYWYFGMPASGTNTVLYLGSEATHLHRYFTDVHQVATVDSPVTAFSVGPIPLWLCRNPRAPWLRLWPKLQHLENTLLSPDR